MSMTTERHTEDASDRVRVGVAELAAASGYTELTTSGLGSCVGVAVADPSAGVAGLAHAMLPEATDGEDSRRPAKAVDHAVDRLLAAVEAEGADRANVEAKIAGGSQMFDFSGVGEGVGERNVERTREELSERGVPVVAEDVGGSHGRSLKLVPATWTLTVTSAHDGAANL